MAARQKALLWALIMLPAVIYAQYAAAPPAVDQCVYSFTINQAQIDQVCGPRSTNPQTPSGIPAELKAEYDKIKAENQALKETVEKLRQDYESMVAGVLKIEQETAGWREVVAWPNVEPAFKPDNETLITVDDPAYADCWDAWISGHKKAGIYKIQTEDAIIPFYAFCDKEGWLVIQRRFDGKETFHRSWDDYSKGFGDLVGEFYIGNEPLHMVSAQRPYELRVELVGWNSKIYHSNYDDFSVGGETDEYAMHIGNMTKGNYFDVLTALNDVGFTARDHDNDQWYSANCADYYRGGFWLTNCGFDLHRDWCDGAGCMSWGSKTMKKSQLKIRPMVAKNGGATDVHVPPVGNPVEEVPNIVDVPEYPEPDLYEEEPKQPEDEDEDDYFEYYDTV